MLQFVPFDQQSDLRHLRDDLADASAIGSDGKLFFRHYVGQLQSVGVVKGALQQRGGDLKSDEIVIVLRCIAALRDLQDIKAKLSFQMGFVIDVVGNCRPVLLSPARGIRCQPTN